MEDGAKISVSVASGRRWYVRGRLFEEEVAVGVADEMIVWCSLGRRYTILVVGLW